MADDLRALRRGRRDARAVVTLLHGPLWLPLAPSTSEILAEAGTGDGGSGSALFSLEDGHDTLVEYDETAMIFS